MDKAKCIKRRYPRLRKYHRDRRQGCLLCGALIGRHELICKRCERATQGLDGVNVRGGGGE